MTRLEGEQLASIAALIATTALCIGCGDVLGTNYDCCAECSLEVAMNEACVMCGWGLGTNHEACSECLDIAQREQDW